MNNFNYSSIYAPYFKQFIAIKRGLGYEPLRAEWIFLEFDNFFKDHNVTYLGITKQQVEQWRVTRMNDSPSTICSKYSILGQFCKFMHILDQNGHRFLAIPDSDSCAKRTLIPADSGQ